MKWLIVIVIAFILGFLAIEYHLHSSIIRNRLSIELDVSSRRLQERLDAIHLLVQAAADKIAAEKLYQKPSEIHDFLRKLYVQESDAQLPYSQSLSGIEWRHYQSKTTQTLYGVKPYKRQCSYRDTHQLSKKCSLVLCDDLTLLISCLAGSQDRDSGAVIVPFYTKETIMPSAIEGLKVRPEVALLFHHESLATFHSDPQKLIIERISVSTSPFELSYALRRSELFWYVMRHSWYKLCYHIMLAALFIAISIRCFSSYQQKKISSQAQKIAQAGKERERTHYAMQELYEKYNKQEEELERCKRVSYMKYDLWYKIYIYAQERLRQASGDILHEATLVHLSCDALNKRVKLILELFEDFFVEREIEVSETLISSHNDGILMREEVFCHIILTIIYYGAVDIPRFGHLAISSSVETRSGREGVLLELISNGFGLDIEGLERCRLQDEESDYLRFNGMVVLGWSRLVTLLSFYKSDVVTRNKQGKRNLRLWIPFDVRPASMTSNVVQLHDV